MSLFFKTKRLTAFTLENEQLNDDLLSKTTKILSYEVVKSLPPYFHNINSQKDAKEWFGKMNAESKLFVIEQSESKTIIGFLFIHGEKKEAHIGYLLGEEFWGKGFAKELLLGLIEFSKEQKIYEKLIGGVAKENIASSYLLEKIGFKKTTSNLDNVDFYELEVCD